MQRTSHTKEKIAMTDWLSHVDHTNLYAVTLTMKQWHESKPLDRATASQNLRHFLNVVNQRFFGNAFKRHGKRLTVIPILEKSAWDRLHYHLSIEKPSHVAELEFNEIVRSCWRRTNCSRKELDIKKIYSDGWLKYCLKSKSPFEVVDFENLHFNCRK